MEYLKELLNDYHIGGTIAEIGTDTGEGSTRIFFDHVRDHGGNFFAVDKFPDIQKYHKVKNQLHLPNTQTIRAYSVDAAENWHEKLDFLFIDGDHNFPSITPDGRQSGVVIDILAWHPHIKKNGILAFHDYDGTTTHYGRIELLGVEYAVDSFCNPPAYRWIGRKGNLVAFEKMSNHILVPQYKRKIVPEEYHKIWQNLSRRAPDISTIVIYGTASSAKYVYDSILTRWTKIPNIIFTDSFVQEESVIFGNNPMIPFDKLKESEFIIVIGSLFEKEITEILHANQKRHLKDYFKLFEFVGWCHLEPLNVVKNSPNFLTAPACPG